VRRRLFALAAAGAFAAGLATLMPCGASAQPAPAAAPVSTGTISGVATDSGGGPLAGVQIVANGPAHAVATTGPNGAYTLSGLPPGVYTIAASKTGYSATTQVDVAVLAGAPQVLNVSLAAATLSSLREIGRVNVSSGRSGFNASPAAVSIISNQAFVDQSQPQVARILEQTPGVVSSLPGGVNNASPGAITFPNIRGALSFETAALIDGHPLSVGQYGDYVTTFLNSFVLQDVELIKGPGAASPTIARAIGGTINFRTLDPSLHLRGTATVGIDSFGGVFSNFGYSNTFGRLGVLVDYAVNGTPGPLHDAQYRMTLDPGVYAVYDSHGQQIDIPNGTVSAANPPGQYNQRGEASTSLVFCCQHLYTTFTNKNELVKLRYKFSEATTLTAGFLGSQTYSDQNGNNSNQLTTAFSPGAGYTGSLAPGTQRIVDPDNFGMPASEINNEPIFQAELRTSLHHDTILGRYYSASISRLAYGSQHDPNGDASFSALVYGGGNGNPVFNGLDQYGKPYTLALPGPNNAGAGVLNNGQLSSGNSYYDSAEEDKLAGSSLEYDHFLGDSGNVISLSYDQNHARTHTYAFAPGGGFNEFVPAGSTQDTATYLLRGIFTIGKLNLTAANYLTNFRSHFGVNDFGTLVFQDQNLWHYDGRLGLTLRMDSDTSARLSLGSAVAPPYLGALVASNTTPNQCSGFFNPCPTTGVPVAVNQVANPNLKAETSFGYDLGADHRFRDGTVLTGDLYLTNLRNQMVKSTYLNGTANVGGTVMPLYTTGYTNVSNARYEGVELGVRRDALRGFGYTVQGALLRAFPYNLPSSFYVGSGGNVATNLGVVPNINFGSHQTISNQAIPYGQAYAEVRYRLPHGALASFGETYYGANNSLGLPAFWVANLTGRVPVGKQTTLQLSVDNLFNLYSDSITNEYAGAQQPFVNGQYYASNANVLGPRIVRFSITQSFGAR
jgi:outer membrane receptor protein involved in Fe transport